MHTIRSAKPLSGIDLRVSPEPRRPVFAPFVCFFIRLSSKFTMVAAVLLGVLVTACGARAAAGAAAPAAAGPVSPRPAEVIDWALRTVVAALADHMLVGQLIVAGVESEVDGRPLARLDDRMRQVIEEVQPGGMVLFGGSFQDIEQTVALIGELHRLVVPPLIATDYEGGLVSRLTSSGGMPATRIPAASVVGRAVRAPDGEGLSLAEELGRVMGRELRALGVTMNLAPVADVDPPGGVGAIGRHGRTFGNDPVHVGRTAAAVTAGLQAAGVAAVVKHFPGHGALASDSHDGSAVLDASLDELRSRELLAFALAFDARPMGVMTAHLTVPRATGNDLPATISPQLTRIAREELGYPGLIVTDALNMRSVTEIAPEPELVVRAIEAGADVLLKPLDPVAARDGLLQARAEGRITRDRLERSVLRIFSVKERLGILGPQWAIDAASAKGSARVATDMLGAPAHTALVERIVDLAGGAE